MRLPRLGALRTKEGTEKFRGRILSATVRRETDRWYVSLTVETERPDPEPILGPVTGVDLGLNSFLAISDGVREEAVPSPKPLGRSLRLPRHLCGPGLVPGGEERGAPATALAPRWGSSWRHAATAAAIPPW